MRILVRGYEGYPELLEQVPGAPPLLYVRGRLGAESFRVGVVGSRSCTAYGVEQAERFGYALAEHGLSLVSGGARGIDTAAHRGALRSGTDMEPTVAVLGCGLSRAYPPENARLFDEIAERGAVVSELPMLAEPLAQNFPARNRLISGMSLGVLVIEAGTKSGALITARLAAEDHGREVMVIPGRVDSPSSAGSLELLKMGGAHCVTEPGDVMHLLKRDAELLHQARDAEDVPKVAPPADPVQAEVLEAIAGGASSGEAVVELTGLDAGAVRSAITMLEISGRVAREGIALRVRV